MGISGVRVTWLSIVGKLEGVGQTAVTEKKDQVQGVLIWPPVFPWASVFPFENITKNPFTLKYSL